jgi:hypothetical protein
MKEIILTQGKVALVDDDDFDRVSAYKWFASFRKRGQAFYARRTDETGKTVELHRFIMRCQKGRVVDHRNGDTLDCRKGNLRMATNIESLRNRGKQSNNKSGFKGVCVRRRRTKKGITVRWQANIDVNGKQNRVGTFLSAIEAAVAHDAAARELFGPFARLNFPKPGEIGALKSIPNQTSPEA